MISIPSCSKMTELHNIVCSYDMEEEDSNKYEMMMISLKGKIIPLKKNSFFSKCTHILCSSLIPTVNIMAGLAAGKWLVSKEFVHKSYQAGKWLNEEEFEITDYRNIAKYHRTRKDKLFSSLICYIEVGEPALTKCFKRILLAGGAIIIQENEDILGPDRKKVVITNARFLPQIQKVLGKSLPALSVDYIKKTIFYKHDPNDIRPFILNPKPTYACPKISVKNNQQQLAVINNAVQSPREGVFNLTPTKARIRHRTKIHGEHSLEGSSTNFRRHSFENTISSKVYSDQGKRPKLDDACSDNDIQFIKEVKSNSYIKDNLEIKNSHELEDIIMNKVSSNKNIGHNLPLATFSENSPTEFNKSHKWASSSFDGKSIQLETKPDNFQNLNVKNNSPILDIYSNNEQTLINKTEINGYMSKNVSKKLEADKLTESTNEESICENVIMTNDENMQESNQRNSHFIFKKNRQKLLQTRSATLNITCNRIRKILSHFLIQLKASHYYLISTHIPIYPYSSLGVEAKEMSPDNSLYISAIESHNSHIVSKRVGRYKMKMIVNKEDCNFSDNDPLIALLSLEWLQLRIQPDCFPSKVSAGLMFKSHILDCPFKEVSNRAISVFQKIVYTHPPSSKQMRNYYLDVFRIASQEKEDVSTQFKGWSFIRRIIRDLLLESSEVNYDIHATVDCIIHTLELDLVHYNEKLISISSLLSYRIWWVGVNQNPSVVNSAIKELIQLWIKSAERDTLTRRKVTKLMSIMLEIVWKWSDTNDPFIFTQWPIHNLWKPIANEIIHQFREMENKGLTLPLVKCLKGPWHQMFLTSLAIRTLDPPDKFMDFSFSSVKSILIKEMNNCSAFVDENGKVPHGSSWLHELRIELLVILMVSFVTATGLKYGKKILTSQFLSSLRKNNVLRSHPEDCVKRQDSLNAQPPSIINEEKKVEHQGIKPPIDLGLSSHTPAHHSELQELNPSLGRMTERFIECFHLLPCSINEMKAEKTKCRHLANLPFTLAL